MSMTAMIDDAPVARLPRAHGVPVVENREAAVAPVVASKARYVPVRPAALASLAHSASAPAKPPLGIHGALVTKARRAVGAAGAATVAVQLTPRQYRCWVF